MKKFSMLAAVGTAASLFIFGTGMSTALAADTCDLPNERWTCVSEEVSKETFNGWIRAGGSDQCRFGPVTVTVTQDVAYNPGTQPVDAKSGEETTTVSAPNPGGASSSCNGLPEGTVIY